MRHSLQFSVAIEAVGTGGAAELSFVPGRHFQGDIGRNRWFLTAQAQSGADVERGVVSGENKFGGSIGIRFVAGIVRAYTENPVERYFLRGIKKMINIGRYLATMAREGFRLHPAA